jgi:hypothetical protein
MPRVLQHELVALVPLTADQIDRMLSGLESDLYWSAPDHLRNNGYVRDPRERADYDETTLDDDELEHIARLDDFTKLEAMLIEHRGLLAATSKNDGA